MLALTLYQPWASACVLGLKLYETRSWTTNHRGPLAIHAAAQTPRAIIRDMGPLYYQLVDEVRNARRTDESGSLRLIEMPTSGIVGVVGIEGCERTEDAIAHIPISELRWGDYSRGRFAWKLLHPIGPKQGFVPLVCSGRQRLWDMPAEVSRLVELQMSLCV